MGRQRARDRRKLATESAADDAKHAVANGHKNGVVTNGIHDGKKNK